MNPTNACWPAHLSRRRFLAAVARTTAAVGISGLPLAGAASARGAVSGGGPRINIFSKNLQWLDCQAMAESTLE